MRSLIRGRLFFDADPPYVTCKAGSTKNRQDARQYIDRELAADLTAHIATKAPEAPVINRPHETNLARMDLGDARKAWLAEAKRDPDEYVQRESSDFLADLNHVREHIDFHSLRHTCGAWLALAGEHPKTIQAIMRHSMITLTMDTYGLLFPGQEADAVSRLSGVMSGTPEYLLATGTDDQVIPFTQRQAQRARREMGRNLATRCEEAANDTPQEKTPRPRPIADLGDAIHGDATPCENRPGGI